MTGRYSVAEEIAHAITHGVGLLFSVAGLVVLVVFASLRGDVWHIVSCSIDGTTVVLPRDWEATVKLKAERRQD